MSVRHGGSEAKARPYAGAGEVGAAGEMPAVLAGAELVPIGQTKPHPRNASKHSAPMIQSIHARHNPMAA